MAWTFFCDTSFSAGEGFTSYLDIFLRAAGCAIRWIRWQLVRGLKCSSLSVSGDVDDVVKLPFRNVFPATVPNREASNDIFSSFKRPSKGSGSSKMRRGLRVESMSGRMQSSYQANWIKQLNFQF